MVHESKLLAFQASLQYMFNDIELLKSSLTHTSYAYENSVNKSSHNERLEFLGDAIIEHVISLKLFKYNPILTEGEMTRKRASIVCEPSLARAMKRIKGHECLYLGRCEQITHGKFKDAIVSDAFEAVIGAIYLDSNFDVVEQVILRLLDEEINLALTTDVLSTDYKTRLQENLQKDGNVKIEYVLVSSKGPEHEKEFMTDLIFNDKKIGEGIGKNKKMSEQNAAKDALIKMEAIK